MRIVLATILISCITVQAHALRPFEDPEAWERKAGVEESFIFEDGVLHINRTDQELGELLTKADYENFHLSFEFNMDTWVESGLFIHAPRNRAYRAGIEIELSDDHGGSPNAYNCGAIFRRIPAKEMSVWDDGAWNTCTVHMDWPRLKVTINGVTVQDLDLSEHESTRHTLRRGALGFQNTGWGMTVRNFELEPLPDTENGIVMLKGDTLDRWEEVRGNVTWTLEDGVLTADDGDGYLLFDEVVEDFDLRTYIRTTPAANGGIFFRWPLHRGYDRPDRGHEIQIFDIKGAGMPTASIYGYARANDLPMTPGEWELLQIHVRGANAVTYLNGVRVAETDRLETVRPGHVVIQMHRPKTSIQYREMVLVPADVE